MLEPSHFCVPTYLDHIVHEAVAEHPVQLKLIVL